MRTVPFTPFPFADDVYSMGMNQLWRPAMLNASRALRQNVVQGRIWGFGVTPEDEFTPPSPSPSNASTSVSSKYAGLPSFPTTVFEDDFSDRDPEAEPLSKSQSERRGWKIAREPSSGTGKVKELVANIERSASGSSADEMSQSPDPFTSPESGAREAELGEEDEEKRVDDDVDAGYASSELTSESEAEDEVRDMVTTPEDDDEHRTPNKLENVRETLQEVSSSSDDVSPTSSILPQTPPPTYIGIGVGLPSSSSPQSKHTRTPSSTIVLSPTRYPNKDSGSDETIENLIANFAAEDSPLAGSWGANAWLDQTQPENTARKIHDLDQEAPVQVSISKRGNRIVSIGRASGKKHKPRMSLTELFEDPAASKVDAGVGTDAEEENQKQKEKLAHQEQLLQEFQARLEEVERKLEEIEARDALLPTTERKEAATETLSQDADLKGLGIATDLEAVPVDGEVQLVDVTNKNSEELGEEEEEEEWEDPSLSGLPSYVFLVGLGMAAVVMRVMIRKVVGDKKPDLLSFS